MTGPPFLICSRKRGTTLPLLAEHVAEADDGERRAAAGGTGANDQLRDPLRRTHHAGRVHRLVGGDQDESVDAALLGRLGEQPRARARCS